MSLTLPNRIMPQRTTANDTSHSEASRTDLSGILGSACWIILGCFALFMIWATSFPLSSAIVAPGTLVADGSNRLVQHMSGGTVVAVLAHDGDRLAAGQAIARLEPTARQADLTRLRARRATLVAIRDRLRAEQGVEGVWSGVIGSLRGIEAGGAMERLQRSLQTEQLQALKEGRVSFEAGIDALTRQARAVKAQREGLDERLRMQNRQIAILNDQIAGMNRLVASGYIAKRTLLETQSRLLDAEARLADLTAERDGADEKLLEIAAHQREAAGKDAHDRAVQLTDVIGELGQIDDQIAAAATALRQNTLRAPVSGTLVDSKLTTIGGVARAGETLAEIVPDDHPALFAATVRPQDIDHVRVGQTAHVEISAFNRRLTDRLAGTVTYVSADTTLDERTGSSHYLARIRLDRTNEAARLTAGMAGTVYIAGPSRTFLAYLFEPLLDGYRRAFAEWH